MRSRTFLRDLHGEGGRAVSCWTNACINSALPSASFWGKADLGAAACLDTFGVVAARGNTWQAVLPGGCEVVFFFFFLVSCFEPACFFPWSQVGRTGGDLGCR